MIVYQACGKTLTFVRLDTNVKYAHTDVTSRRNATCICPTPCCLRQGVCVGGGRGELKTVLQGNSIGHTNFCHKINSRVSTKYRN